MINRFLSILMCLFITSLTHPQELDLTGNGYGARLRLQHILPDEDRLGNAEITNVRTWRFYDQTSSISSDGNVILNEEYLIILDGLNYKRVLLPFSNDSFIGLRYLSSDGNTVITTKRIGDSFNYEFHFFNIEKEVIDYELSLPSGIGVYFNHDASIFTYHLLTETEYKFNLVEKINDTFKISTAIVFTEDDLLRPSIRYLSKYGDRIISSARRTTLNGEHIFFIQDKLDNGWSEPKEWQIFDVEGNKLLAGFLGIASNGRTVLTHTANDGYALTHEVDGQWSVPEPIGYIPQQLDEAQISETGDVIAIQSFQHEDEWLGLRFYDLIVVMKNKEGEWTQHQVNAPQLEVHDGILLSCDGTKLYWLPANTSHIPNALQYK